VFNIEFAGSISDTMSVSGKIETFTKGSMVPTNVINASQNWRVQVILQTTGVDCNRITGSWVVKVDLESMGTTPESQEKEVSLEPGPSPLSYKIDFVFGANTVRAGIYRLIVGVRYKDATGILGELYGQSEEGILQLYTDEPSPKLDPTQIDRAEKYRILKALENPDYEWRTVEDLSQETGLSKDKIESVLKRLSNHIIKSRDLDVRGQERYTTISHYRRIQEGQGKYTNVHVPAKNAILTGSGVVEPAKEIVEVPGGIEVGKDFEGQSVVTSTNQAYDRVVGSTTVLQDQLSLNYKQARQEVKSWLYFSLVSGGLGIILMAIGVIIALLGSITTGVVTAIVSIVLDTVTVLAYRQYNLAKSRVEAISERLEKYQEIYRLIEVVDTIDNSEHRDKAKIEVVQRAISTD
jgi:hypothetical protein